MVALSSVPSSSLSQGVRFGTTASSGSVAQQAIDQFKTHLQHLLAHDAQRPQPVFHRVDAGLFLHLQDFLHQAPHSPLFVKITGASASGKSFYTTCWGQILGQEAQLQRHPNLVESIAQDNYYKHNAHLRDAMRAQLGQEAGEATFFAQYDFDHPESLDLALAAGHLHRLKNGQVVHIPEYTWDGVSAQDVIQVLPARIIFFEGLHALHHPHIRELPGINVFVEAPESTLHDRWTRRAKERLIPDEQHPVFYNRVMTRYREHVVPNRSHAHLVLNGEALKPDIEQSLKVLSNLILTLLDTVTLEALASSK